MKVHTTRGAPRLRHVAGFHSSAADLAAQLLPLLTAAGERGDAVATALRPSTEEALLGLLDGSPELVALAQPDAPEPGSGQTVAARRARELRELTGDGTRAVTVVAEHIDRFDGPDGSYWTELDAAMNVALSELPITLTCFFPELPLHVQITEGARRNHELLLDAGVQRANPEHRPPRTVLAEQPPRPPVLLGPPDVRLRFGAWQLQEVRAAVEQALRDADFRPERAEDVVLAVNEVATNAVEHGGQDAELCLWTGAGLICEVHDRGNLEDPLPGMVAPHPSHPKGRGIWIARQLCDTLHIWSDSAGTHVRMRAAR